MSTSDIVTRIGLVPLVSRRKHNDIGFIHELINDMIHCPEFLSQIGFRVPSFTNRFVLSYHIPPPSTRSYSYSSSICRLSKSRNELVSFDLQ
jgi:hypothetical protein